MSYQNVRSRYLGRTEQSMQVADDVLGRTRHLHGATAIGDPRRIGVQEGPGAVVGADFGGASDARQHCRRESIGEAPRLRRVVVAGFEYDRGTAGAATLQIKLAAAANVDLVGEVT